MMEHCPPTVLPRLFAEFELDAEMIVLAVALIVTLIAGFYLVMRVRRWRLEDVAKPTVYDQLQSYQRLQEEGLLQPQELERIKARLEARTRPNPEADASGPPRA